MGHGGIEDCANAQNCVKACPKEIPLTESLAEINRQAWKQALFRLAGRVTLSHVGMNAALAAFWKIGGWSRGVAIHYQFGKSAG